MSEERQPMHEQLDAPVRPSETEQKARRQGWVPQADFHGKAADWVDAEAFVQRAEQINPILRANNRRLEDDLAALRAQNEQIAADLKSAKESIEGMEEFQEDIIKTAVARERERIVVEIEAAREKGDVRGEIKLHEELAVTNAKLVVKEPPAKEVKEPPAKPALRTPEMLAFEERNPWFTTDPVMGAAAVQVSAQLAASGAFKDLTPVQRLDLTAEKTLERFNMRPRQPSKVEGARGGAGGGEKNTFADVPVEAQAKAMEQAKKLVGPGKKFKTNEDWQKRYASLYFREDWGSHQQAV